MRAQTIAIAIAGLSFTVAAEAQDKPVQVFTPVGPWAMEYADDSCRLARNFTNGQDEATLALERYGPDDEFTIGIAGDSIRAFRTAKETTVSFKPGGAQGQSRSLFRTTLADGRTAFLIPDATLKQPRDVSELSPEEINRLDAQPIVGEEEIKLAETVTAITIYEGLLKAVELQSGSLAEPLKAMHACTDDLLKHWGLDPEVQRHLTRRVTLADSRDFFRSNPLRPLMLPNSVLRARLVVDANGRATQCRIIGAGGSQELVDEACQAFATDSWFAPAQDAEGNPVESYYTMTLRIVLRRQFW